jgi:hypothetical protein
MAVQGDYPDHWNFADILQDINSAYRLMKNLGKMHFAWPTLEV